ncbi:molecular chaperone DnaJ [Candidatus Woesearchaeota archaeon]|nr:molecular chaperone DnaJ [Candidatus Woesearchaeota archaeon]
MAKDYYKILGVEKTATKEEIKRAYKKLAKKYHPDLNKDKPDAADKFKEINEAAAVLADDEKRNQYDQFGTTAEDFGRQGFGGFDFSDVMDNIFGAGFDFDNIFESFFGGSDIFGRRRKGRARGHDLRYDLEITLEEAAEGTTKTITIPRLEKCSECDGKGGSGIQNCPDCNGTGVSRRTQRTPFGIFATQSTCRNCHGEGNIVKKQCSKCHGEGRVEKTRKLEVKIPAGAETGTNLRVVGEGEAGQKGAATGNLYIVIHVKDHKLFERHGNDLFIEVPIPFTIAALGGEIEVPTLKGKATLKIPAGTQTGTTFRMRGKGVPSLHGDGNGNQNVEIKIVTPKKLTKKQKQLLKEFGKTDKSSFFNKLF